MRKVIEFTLFWLMVALLGLLPRSWARAAGAAVAALFWQIASRQRRVGLKNLALAFPEMPEPERERILRSEYRMLGWQIGEFCCMHRYTRQSAEKFIRYEGLENYLAARAAGNGVLVITGHLGAWELSSFYHSLMGYPMSMVIRHLDNPRVDALVNRIRCLHGNRVLDKDNFARGLIASMHAGETVGILMDTNMTPPQGVFVPFFGKLACTGSGLARVALKTNATVLPGFLLWEQNEQRYVLYFGPAVELERTGDTESDAVACTARFTAVLEDWVRRYPEQWLWVHRRWKTRPAGEASLYS
jgi:KDO2-lipid IV(A) lauroyltransferase